VKAEGSMPSAFFISGGMKKDVDFFWCTDIFERFMLA